MMGQLSSKKIQSS